MKNLVITIIMTMVSISSFASSKVILEYPLWYNDSAEIREFSLDLICEIYNKGQAIDFEKKTYDVVELANLYPLAVDSNLGTVKIIYITPSIAENVMSKTNEWYFWEFSIVSGGYYYDMITSVTCSK